MSISSSTPKVALVAGGTGFLGSAVVRRLLKSGFNVYVTKRQRSQLDRLHDVVSKLSFVDVDGGYPIVIPRDVDVVINTAAAYGRSNETVASVFGANLVFPVALLKAAIEQGVRAFINAGTLLPPVMSDYAFAKAAFADYLSTASGSVKRINLRIEHMYGPGDHEPKLVHWLLEQMAQRNAVDLTKGTQRRDFVFVDDIVTAIDVVIDKVNTLDSFCEFQVGTGIATSVRKFVTDLGDEFQRRTGLQPTLRFGTKPTRPNEPDELVANIRQLSAMGWKPEVDVDTGIRRTVDHFLRNRRKIEVSH